MPCWHPHEPDQPIRSITPRAKAGKYEVDSTKCDKQSRQKVGIQPQGAIEMEHNVHMPVII
jgi:hypothetical protein